MEIEATLHEIAHYVALAIESLAVLFIAIGALGALVRICRVGMRSENRDHRRRAIWLSFAHWLVAGLTFQLAADIINTSFSPNWEELGHLAAIAVIRTFLNYFLGRELTERYELQEGEQPHGLP
jgi:uncharacterized membrane protein